MNMLLNVSNHTIVFDLYVGSIACNHLQEKNDEVAYAQKKNDTVVDVQWSCGSTMQLKMYKRIMIKNK